MELANYINYAIKSLLKNPILEVLQEIKITKILKQSNFVKRDVGHPPFQILLHFLYMLVMHKWSGNLNSYTFFNNSKQLFQFVTSH